MVSQEIVGRDGGSARFPVERSKIRELVLAIGEDDAVHVDEGAARAGGYDGIPAPLTWPVLAGPWRDSAAVYQGLGLDFRGLLHGEATWEYLRPVLAGEEVRAERKVTDVTTKEGRRGGRMALVRFETTYTVGDEVVARHNDILIQRGA